MLAASRTTTRQTHAISHFFLSFIVTTAPLQCKGYPFLRNLSVRRTRGRQNPNTLCEAPPIGTAAAPQVTRRCRRQRDDSTGSTSHKYSLLSESPAFCRKYAAASASFLNPADRMQPHPAAQIDGRRMRPLYTFILRVKPRSTADFLGLYSAIDCIILYTIRRCKIYV